MSMGAMAWEARACMWAGRAADGEDAAGDEGVEGFDAAIEHFGEAGDFGDVADGDVGIAEEAGGAAGGDQLGAEGR